MSFKKRFAAVVVAGGLGLVAACGGSGSGSGSGVVDRSAVLRAGWSVGPTTLDPHMQTSDIVAMRFGLMSVYDRLFSIGVDGKVKPMLVTEWAYSKDGLALDLTLREDASFRDGTNLDAAVVKTNLDRARTLDSPVVKNRMTPVTKVEVTGDYTLRLTLAEPTMVMPFVLAEMPGYIMSPKLIESGDPATEADGSGAYAVKSFTPGEKLVLERDREDYWDEDAAQFKQIVHQQIADHNAFSNALSGGQIDIGQFAPNQVAGFKGMPNVETVMVPQGNGNDLYLHKDVGALKDIRVRQAVNHALDREAIVEAMFPGSVAKQQYYREGLPGFDPELENFYGFDQQKAKDLLAEAGHADGVDLGTVIVASSVVPGLGDVIKEQLAEVGIEISLETVDALQIFPRWVEGQAAGMIQSANSGVDPVSGAQENWLNPTRASGEITPEFEELYKAADNNQLSEDEANAAAQALNQYVVEQAWRAPINWTNFAWVMNSRIEGFDAEMDYATVRGPYDFRHLTMTGK